MKTSWERLVLIFIRAGILVFVVLVTVVWVVFFGERSLSVKKLEWLGVGLGLVGGSIFDLCGDFVATVVEDLQLVLKAVVRLVWDCLRGRMYFLWHLSLMSVEGKMPNVGGNLFGMMMRTDFLRLILFLHSGCLGKVMGAKAEMEVVVEMVVELATQVVWANLGVLLGDKVVLV